MESTEKATKPEVKAEKVIKPVEKAKPKVKAPMVVLRERVESLEKTIEEKAKIIDNLLTVVEKVVTLEASLSNMNIEGLKSKVLDLEIGTKKEFAKSSEILTNFKTDFDKFKAVWGHKEEGISVNDHFNSQDVEKPMKYGGPPVDEQGNIIEPKPKSKLQEQMLGELKVLTVP